MAHTMGAWFELCHRSAVPLGAATRMSETLVDAYCEPQRHYHTLAHIGSCLELAADAPLAGPDRDVVEFALWFHDVVYDPRRADNEALSAWLVRDWMDEVGVSGSARVAALVLMTAGHEIGSDADLATQVVHDADLSILGSSPDGYARYREQIRREYAWLSDEEFRSGRRLVLEAFLASGHIYSLPGYVEMFETRARENLSHELKSLPHPHKRK